MNTDSDSPPADVLPFSTDDVWKIVMPWPSTIALARRKNVPPLSAGAKILWHRLHSEIGGYDKPVPFEERELAEAVGSTDSRARGIKRLLYELEGVGLIRIVARLGKKIVVVLHDANGVWQKFQD